MPVKPEALTPVRPALIHHINPAPSRGFCAPQAPPRRYQGLNVLAAQTVRPENLDSPTQCTGLFRKAPTNELSFDDDSEGKIAILKEDRGWIEFLVLSG